MHRCPAKDFVALDALREDPTLPWKKKDWLSRHDRQCGDLLGMLPLVSGMKMLLTDHVDRDERYLMLKGTEVEIEYIQMHPEDEKAARGQTVYIMQHLPLCVYVRKIGALWTIDSLGKPGLYPITCKHGSWYLDANRRPPRLRIQRRQLPLTPAFCVTVHSTQGQDKDPLIVDVNIQANGSKQTCYVALSRARTRRGIYIMRPFDKDTFQGQPPIGPQILLRRLKGEVIQWDEVELELAQRKNAGSSQKKTKVERMSFLVCFACDVLSRSRNFRRPSACAVRNENAANVRKKTLAVEAPVFSSRLAQDRANKSWRRICFRKNSG